MLGYTNFTDDQLAEWDQDRRRIDQLTADLTASRAATVAVQAGAEVERSKLLAELNTIATAVLNLTAKLADQQGATRRLCGEQVQLVRALRALVDAVGAIDADPNAARLFPDVVKPWSEANEVLALVEVPFG